MDLRDGQFSTMWRCLSCFGRWRERNKETEESRQAGREYVPWEGTEDTAHESHHESPGGGTEKPISDPHFVWGQEGPEVQRLAFGTYDQKQGDCIYQMTSKVRGTAKGAGPMGRCGDETADKGAA